MAYLSFDYLIVYVFLFITLIIGIRAGRRAKIKDIREYAIGDKTFGTVALVCTYLATDIGGGTILGDTAEIFSTGIIMTIAFSGLIIAFIVRALLIAPHIVHFKGCLTMGDVMEKLYGRTSKLFTGILNLVNATMVVGIQFMALGVVCETLLGIPATWSIIVGAILMTLYATYGGIKSVVATDVFQFWTLIIVIPLIAYVAVTDMGGTQALFARVPPEKLVVFSHPKFSYYLTLFLLWSFLQAGMIDPAIFQRLLMGKNREQIRNQYLVLAAFDPAFRFVIMIIGLSGLVLYPTIEAKTIVPHIIQTLLPVGFKGLAITGLLAVIISTTDSYLHVAGITFTHDIVKPFFDIARRPIDELRWSRYATFFITVAAILIGLHGGNILDLVFTALEFTAPALMFPLLGGIMGLKQAKKDFYAALVATLVAFGLSKFFLPSSQSHLCTLICMTVNGLIFLGLHLIRNKGFAVVHRAIGVEMIYKPHKKTILTILQQCIPTPQRIVQYSQKKAAQYGAPYVMLGIFLAINYVAPYFLWSSMTSPYTNIAFMLRLVGGTLCVLLIVREKWPSSLLPYMPTLWHLTILYCLPFTSTLMFLLTQGSTEWLINIAIIIILLFILVDLVTGLIIGSLGIVLALVGYRVFIGEIHLSLDFSSKYLLLYQCVFGLLIGLIFARRKEQTFDTLLLQNQQLTENQQATRQELAATLTYREHLLQELKPDEAVLFDDMTTAYIQQVVYRMSDYMRLEVTSISLDVLQKSITELYQSPVIDKQQLVFKKYTQYAALQADLRQLKQLLLNGINYVQQHDTLSNPITIALEDALLGHDVAHMPNYTRQLEALKITITTAPTLPITQPLYKLDPATSSTQVSEHEDEYVLIENARIINAHYGYMKVLSTHTQVYVLPIHLREVRGKVMELIKAPAVADPQELQHPLAIALEKELLEKLQHTVVDTKVVQQALALIKRYHGGVKRKSGEPFFTHLIAVALIALEYSQDQSVILGALLHDTVEDTSLSIKDIERLFGQTVAFLVGKATNLEDHKRRISLGDKENLTRILNYEDPRAALVKLADRLHNMRTIQYHSSLLKQQQIAQETLDEFVPLARKIGLTKMADELEKLSKKVLHK